MNIPISDLRFHPAELRDTTIYNEIYNYSVLSQVAYLAWHVVLREEICGTSRPKELISCEVELLDCREDLELLLVATD